MKIKTAGLIDTALDWAVAKAEGGTHFWSDGVATHWIKLRGEDRALSGGWAQSYQPSTDWAQGGPIIEQEAITVSQGSPVRGLEWMACDRGSTHIQHGPTYLIAAMRCYVASKLGDEVDVPDELCQA
jgi:hypothetical protein